MPATRLRIFISSVQKEFGQVRQDLKAFLLGDAFLQRFIAEVFLFEDSPARDQRADEVYLDEVERCDVFLAIFGDQYGYEDENGISPTERAYEHATRKGKPRLIYVWGTDDDRRAPKMRELVRKASGELIRRRVENASALTAEVYASLVDLLDHRGALRVPPFDAAACDGATLEDLSRKRIEWFLETARRERGFPLAPNIRRRASLSNGTAAALEFGTRSSGEGTGWGQWRHGVPGSRSARTSAVGLTQWGHSGDNGDTARPGWNGCRPPELGRKCAIRRAWARGPTGARALQTAQR